MSFSKKKTTHTLSGMTKYYNPLTNKEVQVGDNVDVQLVQAGSYFRAIIPVESEEVLEQLVVIGCLVMKGSVESPKKPLLTKDQIPVQIGVYLNKIAEKNGWSEAETLQFLNKLYEADKSASFDFLLNFIARFLDEQYPDHIRNSKTVYVIDIDGEIAEISTQGIKSFKGFAAFRTLEDIKTACRILRKFKRELFSGK